MVTLEPPKRIGVKLELLVKPKVVFPANVITELGKGAERSRVVLSGRWMSCRVMAVQSARAAAIPEYSVTTHADVVATAAAAARRGEDRISK